MKKSPHRYPLKILYGGVLLCLILLVSIACIYRLYLFPGTSNILTDADIIQLPTMFLDLQVSLDNFWGWKLPDAPYYFPDTLVFLGVNWLVKDTWQAIALYSLVQSCLVILALSWLYRELGGEKITIFLTSLLTVALIFTQVYTTIFDRVRGAVAPFIYYLSSYIHFGTYISTLFCLAASLNYLRTAKKGSLIFIIIITLLTTVSDLIFAIYFTIPFIATLVISNKAKLLAKDSRITRFCYIIFFTSLVAYIYNKYFDSLAASTAVEIKLSKIIDSIAAFFSDFGNSPLSDRVFLIFTIVFPIVLLLISAIKIKNKLAGNDRLYNKSNRNIFLFITCFYIILAAIANFAAVMILGKYSDIFHNRYFIFIYYSPSLIALVLISLKIEKIKYITQISLAVAAAITIIIGTSAIANKPPALSEIFSPPDYASCFDLQQPQAGISGYWQAKPLIAFSQRKIQVVTVKPDGAPQTWNSNRYWYVDSWQQPGQKPQFEFIFMKSLDPNAIATRYGQPQTVEACLDSEIWRYEDSNALYSNLMRDGLSRRKS